MPDHKYAYVVQSTHKGIQCVVIGPPGLYEHEIIRRAKAGLTSRSAEYPGWCRTIAEADYEIIETHACVLFSGEDY